MVITQKAKLDATISGMLAVPETARVIARRLYLYDPTHAFVADGGRGFDILNEIANHFDLPFSAVRVGGSAQVGYSYFKGHDFSAAGSDLDIAIISSKLFEEFSQHVFRITNRYSDLSRFARTRGAPTHRPFRDYLSTGFFRPDLMPIGDEKDKWFHYFGNLSNKYSQYFKNINGGIYLSERLFEMRNESTIHAYAKGKL